MRAREELAPTDTDEEVSMARRSGTRSRRVAGTRKNVGEQAATAAATQIRTDLEQSARIARQAAGFAGELLPGPSAAEDPGAAARLRTYHRGLDRVVKRMRRDAPAGSQVMTHRSPFPFDHLHEAVFDLIRYERWPRLHVFGASDYRWGWTSKTSTPGVPTPDRAQTVLQQNASFSVGQGTVHVDHRVSNGHSHVKAFVGFPFTPKVTVGKISVRPYLQLADSGIVSVDWSTGWTSGYDKARAYQYGEIYVTSVNQRGGDSRYEGPARARGSYHSMSPSGFATFSDNAVLTVGDGLALEAWVVNTRLYIVWIGCYGWAWSKIEPARASSQAFAVLDCTVPFVVVEEWPVP